VSLHEQGCEEGRGPARHRRCGRGRGRSGGMSCRGLVETRRRRIDLWAWAGQRGRATPGDGVSSARVSPARRRAHRAPPGDQRASGDLLHATAEASDGAGLPQFVEREFREFLACGVFEAGVARFQCEGCGREHLVPFSCKGRGWCPSCGGRRMTERAASSSEAEVAPCARRAKPGISFWVPTGPCRGYLQMK
jgi:transposase-like zinc-binding protein